MAAAAGRSGAWAARTGSGPMRIRGDIFAAVRRWRGRLLTTGRPASCAARHRWRGRRGRLWGRGVGAGGGGGPRARPVRSDM